MKKLTIKKQDTVVVISGKDRGTRGKVLRVIPSENKILVEGVGLKKRHQRPRRSGQKGEIITMPSPIHRSNVMLYCTSCGKGVRVGSRVENNQKTRVCKKCGNVI